MVRARGVVWAGIAAPLNDLGWAEFTGITAVREIGGGAGGRVAWTW